MRRTLLALAAIVGAALVAVGPAQPAAADGVSSAHTVWTPGVSTGHAGDPAGTAQSGYGRQTSLVLVVRPSSGPTKAAWLTCDQAAGSHPHPRAACRVLTAADGDPDAIPPGDGMCTAEFAPVTTTLRGRWHGRPVRYRKTFSNPCMMVLATGPLFQL